MATANNTYDVRIQLKNDIEANWIAHPIVPLAGEVIIYSADREHPYSRLKIGDGTLNTDNLPFIDAGTLNGDASFILKYANFASFPSPGSPDKLYVDLSTSNIYHYTANTGYTQLAQFTVSTATIHDVVFWGAGTMTNASVASGILTIKNGIAPQLLTQNTQVVTNITGGVSI